MKKIIFLLLVPQIVLSTWKLGMIDNQAVGLTLQQAWNYKAGKKVRVLPSITNALKKATSKQRTSIVVDYEVDNHGLAITGVSSSGQTVTIFMDSQAVHSIEWNRKKSVSIAEFPASSCAGNQGQFCARAMVQDADGAVLSNSGGQAYEGEGTVLDLVVTGDAQNFAVTLVPA